MAVARVAAVVAVAAAAVRRFLLSLVLIPGSALADEGGVSFWVPGAFGSFAAVQSNPGWSLPLAYYHRAGDANSSARSRDADALFAAPTYVFSQFVAGAQASAGLGVPFGRVSTDDDSRSGLGDLYPTFTLKTAKGVHNYMSYTMLGVPTGAYDKTRTANIGTNHWSLDGGGGYTYENAGRELSGVLGFTYNFRNPDTDYRNGLSSHLDWAASQPLSSTFRAGVVGYAYYQLGEDHGPGGVKSRVYALGPQAGWTFGKWNINARAYYEFGAHNRPEGWNAWLTVTIPLSRK